MAEYNKMQQTKRHFFAMRNGIIADTIRRAGLDYKIIFGLNLPQIADYAAATGYDPDLAAQLRADVRCRESQLLAPMLVDPATLTLDDALAMAREVRTTEVADILCHRLLRRRPEMAAEITEALTADATPLSVYTALRLALNLLAVAPPASEQSERYTALAKQSLEATAAVGDTSLAGIRRQMADELEYRP